MSKTIKILGVDPGTNILGYACLSVSGDQLCCERSGILKMQTYATQQEKLKRIFQRIKELVLSHQPDHMAIEAPFFGKNVQSMLKLGRAQGVAIAAAMMADVPVSEYSPKKIKLSITGNGNASKEQVLGLLKHQVKMNEQIESLDESDALAAAVCHYYQSQSPLLGAQQFSNWSDFLKNNPDRIL